MKDIKIIKLFWSVSVSRYPKIQFPIVIYYKIMQLKKEKKIKYAIPTHTQIAGLMSPSKKIFYSIYYTHSFGGNDRSVQQRQPTS